MLSPLALAISQQALAGEFEWGEVSGRYNGSLSAGAIWSAERPNNDYIFQGNADSIGYGSAGQFNPSGAKTIDDSRLNYHKRREVVSSPVTLLGEVELKWQNYGAFVRGKAWYDYSLSNDSVDYGHSANGYTPNSKLDDSHYDRLAKFQGLALLDAYVFGDFDIADHPLHARLGNQVVNWGEGLFFQNGINSVNPIDVAALRRPGSQLKEALLPVPIAYFNLGLTDALSMEAFYQLKWRKTVLEGCGTYFAANDYITGGEAGCFGVPLAGANDQQAFANDLILHRAEDNDARNDGQFGVAFRYFADSIGTEFGAYAMNIHSRTPFASVITDSRAAIGPGFIPGQQGTNAQYFGDYPEDIRIYGLSFSTNILGTSVFGEYSYRPNQPIQLATGDLIPAFAGNPAAIAGAIGQNLTLGQDAINAAPGSVYNGYDRREISQFSLGFIKSIPQVLGASNFSVMGEAAAKYVHDLPGLEDRRYIKGDLYGTDFADGNAAGCAAGSPAQYRKYTCSSDGNATKFSWGYRMRMQLDYPGLVAGVNVSPYVAFGQDVQGWSHDGNFVEDRLLGSVGVKADYLQNYSAELSWSGTGNTAFAATDRDFVALSLRMGF
ncbi:DUF1302 domain-containing protein [Pseudomonas alkylphenolica]|uniref:DUF1302 domain-containing protein n=1 Tax=Pseudomonas alkylphenolica TaxID=237609 RepID=UPI00211BCC25|nr:DUF1302 domain-containing protein [Pseudomonas alkylphenolica]